jgi:hypothetical protein
VEKTKVRRLMTSVALVAGCLVVTPAGAVELNGEQIGAIAQASIRGPGGVIYEDVLASLVRPVRLYDFDRDGLDQADMARAAQVRNARLRSPALAALLAFDLDNNQRVTRDEYEIAGRANPLGRVMGLVMGGPNADDPFVLRDEDGDDVLSWAEMSKLRSAAESRPDPIYDVASFLLDLDPSPNDSFSLADARAVADAAFAKIDENRNGAIEQTELTNVTARARVRLKLNRPSPN